MSAISWLIASLIPLTPSDDSCYRDCTISHEGVNFIAHFEGYVPVRYKDPIGIVTIGYGHVVKEGEVIREPLTPDTAKELLRKDIEEHEAGMTSAIKQPLKQPQWDAVASWTFNLGVGSLNRSNLLKRLNAGEHAQVPDEIRKWIYAGGQVLRGLVIRREAEANLYRKGM